GGGAFQDLKLLASGIAVVDGAANLNQERGERLADAVVDLTREPLPLDGQPALPAPLAQPLVSEPPRDAQDVRDPAGDQLQDGDPLGRDRLTTRPPLFAHDENPLGAGPGEERKDQPDPGGRPEQRPTFGRMRQVVMAEGEHDRPSFPQRLRASRELLEWPARHPHPPRRAMPGRRSDGEPLPRVANGDLAIG